MAPSKSGKRQHAAAAEPAPALGAPATSSTVEAHLTGPDFEVYGATQVGLPIVRFAFNQQMGITNTVNSMVGATNYKLTLEDGGYLFDGKVLPFKTQSTTYKVRQARTDRWSPSR
ncbi:penicillin acylase family protein [Caulobacter segnis]